MAIRYAAWSILLARSGERLVAAPLVFGIALWAFARFGVEGRWINPRTRGEPKLSNSPSDDLMSAVRNSP